MTIPLINISKALEKGLNPSKYIHLLIKQDGAEYLFSDFLSSEEEISLLANGYITENLAITQKAKNLLIEISGEPVKKGINYKTLHQELQNSLIASYGKKQKEGFGGVYFIPTVKELEEFLGRFWKAYPDYKETEKITKILKQHVEKCGKSGKFAPAVKYFIYKQGAGSQLAGAYEGFEEIEVKEERVEPQEIKNLF